MDERKFQTKISKSSEDVIAFYDEYAKHWDNRFDVDKSTDEFINARYKAFCEHLQGRRFCIAAELGAGTGIYISKIHRHFKKLIAIDGSQKMLNKLDERLKHHGIRNVTIIKDNAETLETLDSNSMDMVYFFGLLEHIINVDSFIINIRRVLKKNGLLIGNIPNRLCPWYSIRKCIRGTGTHCSSDRYYTSREIKKLFKKYEFELVMLTFRGFLPAIKMNTIIFMLLRLSNKLLIYTPIRYFAGGIYFTFRKSNN